MTHDWLGAKLVVHASDWLGAASLNPAFGSMVLGRTVVRILGRPCNSCAWMLSVGFSFLIYKASSMASRLGSAADVMISVVFSRYTLFIIAWCFHVCGILVPQMLGGR